MMTKAGRKPVHKESEYLRIDPLLGKMTDVDISKLAGVEMTVDVIRSRRYKLNIGSYESGGRQSCRTTTQLLYDWATVDSKKNR